MMRARVGRSGPSSVEAMVLSRARRLRVRVLVAAVTGAMLVGGCLFSGGDGTGLSEQEVAQQSDETREQVIAIADRVTKTARDLNPGLGMRFNPHLRLQLRPDTDAVEDYYLDCSGDQFWESTDDAPTRIEWRSERKLTVVPAQETGSLVDPIVAQFVAEGWQIRDEERHNEWHRVTLYRNVYSLDIAGAAQPDPGEDALLKYNVMSNPIPAPVDILERYDD